MITRQSRAKTLKLVTFRCQTDARKRRPRLQKGIGSYVLHMDVGTVHIATPLRELRIGAVNRGPGSRDIKERKWESFDQHLFTLAQEKGANVIHSRVDDVGMENGRSQLTTKDGTSQPYDFLAVAIDVNSRSLKVFEGLGLGYKLTAGQVLSAGSNRQLITHLLDELDNCGQAVDGLLRDAENRLSVALGNIASSSSQTRRCPPRTGICFPLACAASLTGCWNRRHSLRPRVVLFVCAQKHAVGTGHFPLFYWEDSTHRGNLGL